MYFWGLCLFIHDLVCFNIPNSRNTIDLHAYIFIYRKAQMPNSVALVRHWINLYKWGLEIEQICYDYLKLDYITAIGDKIRSISDEWQVMWLPKKIKRLCLFCLLLKKFCIQFFSIVVFLCILLQKNYEIIKYGSGVLATSIVQYGNYILQM